MKSDNLRTEIIPVNLDVSTQLYIPEDEKSHLKENKKVKKSVRFSIDGKNIFLHSQELIESELKSEFQREELVTSTKVTKKKGKRKPEKNTKKVIKLILQKIIVLVFQEIQKLMKLLHQCQLKFLNKMLIQK